MSNTNIFIVTGGQGGHPGEKQTDNSFVCNFSTAVSGHSQNHEPLGARGAARRELDGTCHKHVQQSHKFLAQGRLDHDLKTDGVKVFACKDDTARTVFEMTAGGSGTAVINGMTRRLS
jgi:hypothetical protein